MHQGIATGLHVLGARLIGGQVEAALRLVLPAGAGPGVGLVAHGVLGGVGHAASLLPEDEGETLWRSGVRTGGGIVRAVALSGAAYEGARLLRTASPSAARPRATAGVVLGGSVAWAARSPTPS